MNRLQNLWYKMYCGCIKSLFTAEKRKEGAKLRRDILLYFNALRSSVVFLSGSLRLNFLLLIQPLNVNDPQWSLRNWG